MLRNFFGVIAGAIGGWLIFSVIQLANYLIVPRPAGIDVNDTVSTKEFIDNMPIYGWLVLIFGYVAGSIVAGYIAGKITESKTRLFPVLISLFFLLGWISNIMFIPHPLWVVILVLVIFLPATFFGHRFAISGRD